MLFLWMKKLLTEQKQRLLEHVRIDSTLQYAIVNQNNVKIAHKKYIGEPQLYMGIFL